jgi:hypothetical protein
MNGKKLWIQFWTEKDKQREKNNCMASRWGGLSCFGVQRTTTLPHPPNPRPRGSGFVSVGWGKAQRFYSVREFERIVSKNQPKIDYILTSNDDDMGDLPF